MQLNNAKKRDTDIFKIQSEKTIARSSIMTEEFKQEYLNIKTDKILPFKNQARKNFDVKSIASLSETIKKYGIRQPLSVILSSESPGYYEVISGERRLRAAKLANIEKVPCILIKDISKAEEIAIVENMQRKNLHPLELANAYKSLIDKKICISMQDVADKIGISKSSVVEIMNLHSLPEETKMKILSNNLKSRDLYRTLLKSNVLKHNDIIEQYNKNSLTKKYKLINKRGVTRKSNILNIQLNNGIISLTQNKIKLLTSDNKVRLKDCLSDLIMQLNN